MSFLRRLRGAVSVGEGRKILAKRFFTIGHSTRTIAEFIQLLDEARVEVVADVRAIPRSRTNPQFNQDSLRAALERAGCDYEHLSALGGRRSRVQVGASRNSYWDNISFRNYADYALTEPFHRGLRRLVDIGHERPCAIMCAEAVWWRCHRRIIADYLLSLGETVDHILGPGGIRNAVLTPEARVVSDGLIYVVSDT